jgi:DNA-binding transcriptional LysR family regulator
MMTEHEISFSQLRCFIAVVDAGSLAKAGRQLGMSTPSVSKAIARLEKTSGVKLLHRSTHAVSLTQEGERLIESAREVVRAAGVFSRSAQAQTQTDSSGWVRLTAPVALTQDVLTPLLPRFNHDNPSIRLDIRSTNQLLDLAREGVDVAIRSGSLARVPGHVQTTWFKFPWVACASPTYLKGRQQPRHPNDLSGHQLIGFRNQRTGQVRPWSFRQPGKRGSVIQSVPDPMTIYDDGGSAWNAALHGSGIVSAPLWLAAADLRGGRAVELLREWRDADVTMYFLRRDRRLTPPRVSRVIAYLRRHAPALADLI